jgi:septal ring factor EnvC (AmiA/AmiB activator)
MKKVEKGINAAINKALADAKKAAIKKAKDDGVKENNNDAVNNITKAETKSVSVSPKKTETKKAPESVLLNAENTALNENFIKNKGSLPWPVDKGYPLLHFGRNVLPSGTIIDITNITISTDIGSNVKSIFDGVVSNILYIEDMQVIIIQHGKYFSTYSNLSGATVQRGQNVKTGQVIGKAAANLDGIGAVDLFISDERSNIDPERWLKR